MRRVNLKKILFILHFHRLEFMTRQSYNVKKVSTKNTWHWGILWVLLLGKSCLHLFGLHWITAYVLTWRQILRLRAFFPSKTKCVDGNWHWYLRNSSLSIVARCTVFDTERDHFDKFRTKKFFGTRPAGSNYPSKGLGGVYHLISCRYC